MGIIQPELPQSTEAERATLGSILLNRNAITPISAWLEPSMFYLERHALIYTAMLSCYRRRVPPDSRLVAEELRHQGKLSEVGGVSYLTDLAESVPTSYHVEFYALEVKKLSVLRNLILAGGKIAALGYEAFERGLSFETALGDAHAILNAAIGRGHGKRMTPMSEIVDAFYERMESGVVSGTPTGFRDYDDLTGGLHGGDLVIIAARPSVGKSSFALSLIDNLAELFLNSGESIMLFSLEMSQEQLNERLIAMRTGLSTQQVRRAVSLKEDDLARVMWAAGEVHRLPIAINDHSDMSVDDIRSLTLKSHGERPVGLVVVDYLQLMEGTQRKNGNRNEEVSQMSRGLKKLARELNIPVIALSQLNRAVEGRLVKIPTLADLRDSGAIEQDADQVLFLYREELYNKETDKKGIVEMYIAKQRQGPLGVIPLRFDAATTRFDTLTYRTPDGY